ncbi:MAG: cyclodeaminase/cyclohydrolase family protein [Phycisphaerae bacterium]|nr:cyclodeaminase/cyclohydrolase family protein [Phycisphaerae bacterium]
MVDSKQMLKLSVTEFTAATAAKQPTPGGGSVAGLVGALATGLGEMALNFTIGKKKYAEFAELHASISSRLEKARGMFLDLVADDITAYSMYGEATQLPDGAEKDAALELALAAAINVPREMAKLCLAVMQDIKTLTTCSNRFLVSDLVAGAALASGTTVLCDMNVRINARSLSDKAVANEIREGSTKDRLAAAGLALEIEEAVKEHLD